jgi:hypothetical protein
MYQYFIKRMLFLPNRDDPEVYYFPIPVFTPKPECIYLYHLPLHIPIYLLPFVIVIENF